MNLDRPDSDQTTSDLVTSVLHFRKAKGSCQILRTRNQFSVCSGKGRCTPCLYHRMLRTSILLFRKAFRNILFSWKKAHPSLHKARSTLAYNPSKSTK